MNKDTNALLKQLTDFLELYLVKKAPALPENAKEIIVKYSPYISVVLILIGIPAMLLILGIGAAVTPFAMMGGYNPLSAFSLGTIFSLVSMVLDGLAIPGLFARKISGWNFMFYASLVSAVEAIVTFNLGQLIVGSLISFYILFQIKSYYKN